MVWLYMLEKLWNYSCHGTKYKLNPSYGLKMRAVQNVNIKVASITLTFKLIARAGDIAEINFGPISIIIPSIIWS